MRLPFLLPVVLLLSPSACTALPSSTFSSTSPKHTPTTTTKHIPLPLVVWHGLGDTFSSPGLNNVAELYQSVYPSALVYPIHLSTNPSTDRRLTFLGHIPTQISTICEDLLALTPSLPHGFHALGFSQGGQFLRAYIQQCNAPRAHTLVTFGSQHLGISAFLGSNCRPADFACHTADRLLRSNRWSSWVQSNVVPAQYFRDPKEMDEYLEFSGWLADVNNEREDARNETYAQNLATLEKFVMYVFKNDTTVVPKGTGWFDDIDPQTGEVVKLVDTIMYKEDWLGLRKLNEEGKLAFRETEGPHMSITDEVLLEIFKNDMKPIAVTVEVEEELGDEEVERQQVLEDEL